MSSTNSTKRKDSSISIVFLAAIFLPMAALFAFAFHAVFGVAILNAVVLGLGTVGFAMAMTPVRNILSDKLG